MKLIFETKDFKRVEGKSTYNRNYYRNSRGIELLEVCHEDYNFFEYRLIEGERWDFIGCSYDSMKSPIVEIDFKEFYT